MTRGLNCCLLAILIGLGCRSALAQVDSPDEPAAALPAGSPAALESLREQAAQPTKTPSESAERLTALFAAASDEQLAILAFDPDPTISLQAAWEYHLRTNADLVPAAELRQENDASAERLLGFIEGRTAAPIPEPWAYRFTAKFYAGQPALERSALARFPHRWQTLFYLQVATSKEAARRRPIKEDSSLKREAGVVEIRRGEQTLGTVDDRIVELAANRPLVAVQPGPDCWIVALYTHFPDGFPLFCLEVPTGKVRWRAHVWGASRPKGMLLGRTGTWMHEVLLTTVDRRVAVFGLGTFGTCYTEGFDLQTGTPLYRFVTRKHEPQPAATGE